MLNYSVLAVFIFILLFGITMVLCIRKIPTDRAGVRTGFGGIRVGKGWMICVPFFQNLQVMDVSVKKLEVVRKGQNGLICRDNIRADIEVVFYVRVNDEKTEDETGKSDFHHIRTVATQIGCERASNIDILKQLFEAKFSEALKSAGREVDFEFLYTKRTSFREAVIRTIGDDLDGYVLEDVAIDYLEQTPLMEHDPTNVLDAQGIKKIVELTSSMETAINERKLAKDKTINEQNRQSEIEITELNIKAEIEKRMLDRDLAEQLAQLSRDLDLSLAREQKLLDEEIQSIFPDKNSVEEIHAHIRKNHPIYEDIAALRQEVEQLRASLAGRG